MKILALITDGFGGNGGIALYTRHILISVCNLKSVDEVVAVPRISPIYSESMPENLEYLSEAGVGTMQYLKVFLKQCLNPTKADVVICSHINLLPAAVLVKWLKGSKLVLIIYGIEAWSSPSRGVILRCIPYVDKVVSISAITRIRFCEWSGVSNNRVSIIPNGIELDRYGPGDKPPDLISRYKLDDKRVILTVGRLAGKERSKGFDEIIAAMPKLLSTDPNIRYLIVGSGPDKGRLERLVRETRIGHAVIFSGQVDETEKADYFRVADVFAMPGQNEGFGYVYLEALACGVPVIGSNLDGSREALMNGEIGELVDPANQEQLISAIRSALEQPKSVPAKLEHFSFENFQRRFQSAILDIPGMGD